MSRGEGKKERIWEIINGRKVKYRSVGRFTCEMECDTGSVWQHEVECDYDSMECGNTI